MQKRMVPNDISPRKKKPFFFIATFRPDIFYHQNLSIF